MMKTGFQYSQFFGILRILFQIVYTKVTAEHNISAVISFLTGKYIQQGGFTCTVFSYQADTLAFGNTEGNIFEKYQIPKGFGKVIYLQIRGHNNRI